MLNVHFLINIIVQLKLPLGSVCCGLAPKMVVNWPIWWLSNGQRKVNRPFVIWCTILEWFVYWTDFDLFKQNLKKLFVFIILNLLLILKNPSDATLLSKEFFCFLRNKFYSHFEYRIKIMVLVSFHHELRLFELLTTSWHFFELIWIS